MVRVWMLSLAAVLSLAAGVSAQEMEAPPSPYFDCPYVNYFDTDCPQLRRLWEEQERRRMQEQEGVGTSPRNDEPNVAAEEAERDGTLPHGLGPDGTYLLFPKESLAPDAPELFRVLLTDPTLENARRYVRWYARRTARLHAVQALIEQAGREVEVGLGGEWQ